MKFNQFLISISTLLMFCCSTLANTTDCVDEYVLSQMQKKKIPGMSIAIVKNGEIVKVKGYGLANIELNVPATPDTVYQSGSIAKTFTATLIMMLVERGKLGLDDKINLYFKEAPKTWQNITIRHLLTHTSGIYGYTNNPLNINFRLDYTDEELFKLIASKPLDFQPGDKFNYSNSGYVLLGMIIKNVTGKHWGDLAEEYIFKPLDMKTARIMSEADIIPNRAAGYRLVNGELKNQEYVSPSLNRVADGSLYLTVFDLAKWDKALYTEKLLKQSTLKQMWTLARLNNGKTADGYGIGWELEKLNNHPVVFHCGAWQGFRGEIDRFINDKLTIIFLDNRESGQGFIGYGIAGCYEPALVPTDPQEIEKIKK